MHLLLCFYLILSKLCRCKRTLKRMYFILHSRPYINILKCSLDIINYPLNRSPNTFPFRFLLKQEWELTIKHHCFILSCRNFTLESSNPLTVINWRLPPWNCSPGTIQWMLRQGVLGGYFPMVWFNQIIVYALLYVNDVVEFYLRMYSLFQNQRAPLLSYFAEATRRLILSCLALFCHGWTKMNHPRTCLWLLATPVVIGLHNVLEEFYTCTKCEMNIHFYWKDRICWKYQHHRQSKTRQDEAKQGKKVLKNIAFYISNYIIGAIDHYVTACLTIKYDCYIS